MNKFTVPFLASVCITGSAFAQGGDDCTVPTPLSAFGTVGFDTTAATTSVFDGGGACGFGADLINQDLFWVFTAPVSGDIQFDTDGSSFDTRMSVHMGADCSATCLDTDDDGGAGLQSLIQILGATQGDQFLVQVGGFGTNFGTGQLNITQFVDPCSVAVDDSFEDNDTCQTAVPIASGSYIDLFASTSDSDFYTFTLQPDDILDFTCSNDVNADVDLNLFDAGCNLLQTFNADALTTGNPGGAGPLTVIVEVFVDPTAANNCSNYDLDVVIAIDPCVAGVDDAFEDNDLCTSPVAMMPGFFSTLFVSRNDLDYYRVTVQPDQILSAEGLNTTLGAVDVAIYDANCNVLDDPGFGAAEWSTLGAAGPTDLIVEVRMDAFTASNCTNYDLEIISMDDPCTLGPDMFEDNDDCVGAVALGDGFYPGLTVFESDNDYFAVGVDPGVTMTADIFFLNATADVDIYLWDPVVDCDTNVAGTAGAFLVRGFTASDDETISYTNSTGAPQNLILEIDMFTGGGCNTYDLQVAGLNGMGGGPGTSYCPGNPNSTGMPSEISALGSRVVANNDLTLTATDLPPLVFGFFIASRLQGLVMNPAGSAGNLCLSGAIGRYVGSGEIMNSGLAGEISLTIDLTAIPQPLGFEAVMSGDQWNFQLWHRDAGSTSNFTNGVQVDFI